ncbi:hypothetical protein B0H14DRAFT_2559594 [Mycena olivaceomarginata]|nr:hypothetical protein B0H14DRAFT_2559594 [Mycena olivaceomarginata]
MSSEVPAIYSVLRTPIKGVKERDNAPKMRSLISQSLWEDSGQHSASILIIGFRAWCSGFPYPRNKKGQMKRYPGANPGDNRRTFKQKDQRRQKGSNDYGHFEAAADLCGGAGGFDGNTQRYQQ